MASIYEMHWFQLKYSKICIILVTIDDCILGNKISKHQNISNKDEIRQNFKDKVLNYPHLFLMQSFLDFLQFILFSN